MTTVLFKCKCPCVKCGGDGPMIQWHCPRCGSEKLFDENAKIICPKHREDDHYIWRATFKCLNGDEEYHDVSYQGLLLTLATMGSIKNPPLGFIKKVTAQCMAHMDDFLHE